MKYEDSKKEKVSYYSLIFSYYFLAVILTAAALFLRSYLTVSFGERPLLILFMLPIFISAIFGGFGPGIIATILSALSTNYFFIPEIKSLIIIAEHDIIQWVMLIISGLFASIISEFHHRSRTREKLQYNELKTALHRLDDSERMFRSTFDQAAVGIAHVAPDGRWLRVNDRLCEITGYSRGDLLASTFQKITHPDDLDKDLNLVEQMLNREVVTYSMEKRYIRRDSSIVWINLTVSLTWKEDDTPDYFISVVEEITARKHAEQELKLWADIFQNVAFGFVVGLPGENKLGVMNPAFAGMHGYTRDELNGTSVEEVFAPEDRAGLPGHIRLVHEKGHHVWEARHIRRDGSVFPVIVDAVAVKDESGSVLYRIVTVQDISERKEADIKLRESEARYHGVMDLMIEGCQILDFNWHYIYVNDSVAVQAHKEKSELLGRAMAEVFPGIETTEMFMYLQRCMEERIPHKMNNEFIYPDGSKGYFELSIQPVPEGIFILSSDITDRVMLEKKLRENEERLRLFIEHAPAALAMFDSEMKYIAASKRWRSDYSLGDIELTGRSHYQIFPEITEDLKAVHRRGLKGEVITGDEDRFIREDGSVQWVKWEQRPWLAVDGTIGGIVIFTEDITARKDAEEKLRESEEHFRQLFSSSSDGIYLLEITGDGPGCFIEVNDAACTQLEYTHDELLNMTPFDIAPGMTEEMAKSIAESFLEKKEIIFEAEHVTKSGRIIPVEINSKLIESRGRNVMMSIARDITERKKIESGLLQLNEELEKRVALRTSDLESFSYSISHDLRAPLRHISGFIEMLHEEIGAGINEKSKHYIEVVENAAAKMEQQMNALLAFYRVGQGDPRKENVDMTTVLADVLDDFTDEIDSRGIRILIGPLPVVIGDRGALRVVLCNLVSNAVKYTSKKDDPVIEIGFKNDGSEYIFYVRDNGAGFDMNYSDKLFNVFKRLHSENEFKGIGIGLAMVKSIIERHGGRVWAEGQPGEGACFYFSLPPPVDRADVPSE